MLATLGFSAIFTTSLVAAPVSRTDVPMEVIQVDRREAFAGKLGKRISQRLLVKADGRTISIPVRMGHTICGKVPVFHIGDLIMVDESAPFGLRVVGKKG